MSFPLYGSLQQFELLKTIKAYSDWPPVFLEMQLLVRWVHHGIFALLIQPSEEKKKKTHENRISPVSYYFWKETHTHTHTKERDIERKKWKSTDKEIIVVMHTSLGPLLGAWASITGGFKRYFGKKLYFWWRVTDLALGFSVHCDYIIFFQMKNTDPSYSYNLD